MEIRPVQVDDLAGLQEIDGTVESPRYLHLDYADTSDAPAPGEGDEGGGDEARGVTFAWRLEERPARQKLIEPNRLDDDATFTLKSVVTGAEEGTALLIEHDDEPVAMLLARPDPAAGTLRIVDLRVDYDYRRQGLGIAMVYQIISGARDAGHRAVTATTLTNNIPAARFLAKAGFDLGGVDTHYATNHDLVKEAVALFWYAALD